LLTCGSVRALDNSTSRYSLIHQEGAMNYRILFTGSVLGGVIGAVVASDQAPGVQFVLAGIGCVAGAAIGGAIRKTLRKAREQADPSDGQSDGLAASQRELNDNYWINHGHLTSTPALPEADDSDAAL